MVDFDYSRLDRRLSHNGLSPDTQLSPPRVPISAPCSQEQAHPRDTIQRLAIFTTSHLRFVGRSSAPQAQFKLVPSKSLRNRFDVYSCRRKCTHHKRSGNLQYQRCRLSVLGPIFTRSTTLLDGLKVIERFFNVPLDHAKPEGEKIRIFARHVIPKDKAKTPEEEAKLPFRTCRNY